MKSNFFPRLMPVALAVSAVCALTSQAVLASSHREAPGITHSPKVDGTDLYLFRSFESPQRSGFVTVIANYQPFQDPQGGPNFYQFDPDALYEIHFDSNGDAVEDLTFQFRFQNTLKGITLPIGKAGEQKNVAIPLIQSDGIPSNRMNADSLNVRETFTVDVVRNDRRKGTRVGKLSNASGGATTFDKPVDNIGDKTFGGASGYETYANQHVYNVNLSSVIPGCNEQGRVFVGQRKEPFYIAVGKIFDLINLNPLGTDQVNGNKNDLEFKNVSSLALELPISCVAPAATTTKTEAGGRVIGAWTTASVRQGRLYNPMPAGQNNHAKNGGAWTQVSRLGMPLVNEVVIGIPDKDLFNAVKPTADSALLTYVTHPVLPALIEKLFPSAPAPKNFPRNDLVAAFLTGLAPVNQPVGVKASEMMRLNVDLPVTLQAAQNPLGVLAGDNAGFPNGRRPGDDVVDAALRVAMGALCVANGTGNNLKLGADCTPSVAPAGGAEINDGVRRNAASFKRTTFPYLDTPLPGNFNN